LSAAAKVLAFASLFAVFVVVPSRILPTSLWPVVVVVVHGFELTLAGYSYFCAAAGHDRRASLGDALFFMLVTPELVFPARGQHIATRTAVDVALALLRVALGAALMLAVVLLRGLNKPAIPPLSLHAWSDGLVAGAVAFALLYGSHSALAHLQIGLCRVVGYRAPERYHFPFAAVSPSDFWSRWNRYIAHWLRCYVHAPLARIVGPTVPRPARSLIATLGAFLFLGLFHDAYFWLIERKMTLLGTAGFVFWGVMVWMWRPVDSAIAASTSLRQLVHRETSRAAFLLGLCLSVWVFL
jgi:D-alanyl-lipoteichoic acid acyltransferase DltB (MBOAT superfamily)